MEIRIGMQNVNRELVLEVEDSVDDLTKAVAKAIKGGEELVLTDKKDKTVVVAGSSIAYVECGDPESRQVGFVR